ncbi:hypothetical protein GQ55_2G132800 [Panicum hallii var. hallii]|uniref:Uncharacterized protein n=1 Tax=Panicum hallii var. hallii TaxID=1504633 RepID=A0A2T7EPF9_9POAL|nr:hypothetical protein GQ55_2G132800 [Panicum hallii var. hallii]
MQDGKDSVQFALPAQCPKSSFTCLKDMPSLDSLISMEESDNPATPDSKGKGIANSEVPSPATPLEQFQQKISPSTGPWSKSLLDQAGQAKLVEKNGFRDVQCSKKGCLGCLVTPPTLSPSVIRNLGASFCNLDADSLTDIALNKKKKVSAPAGKKPIKKKANNKDVTDAKQDKKKPKMLFR